MGTLTKLSDADIKVLAEAVLGPEMNDIGFEGADVRSGTDNDDTPSLFITARVGAGIPAPLARGRFRLSHRQLHDALLSHGEERFPYFRLSRADDEVPEDDFPALNP